VVGSAVRRRRRHPLRPHEQHRPPSKRHIPDQVLPPAVRDGHHLAPAAPVTVPIVSTATAVISMRSTSGGSAHGIGSCSREM
jgi:hypothetical protein